MRMRSIQVQFGACESAGAGSQQEERAGGSWRDGLCARGSSRTEPEPLT